MEIANPRAKLLVVDDEALQLRAVCSLLGAHGFDVVAADSGARAFELLDEHPELAGVLTDLYMPGISGMDLLMHVKQARPDLSVVVLTGNADVPSAVSAIHAGALDYLIKPVDGEALSLAMGRAVERHRLLRRNLYLEQRLKVADRYAGLVGTSPLMRQVFELVAQVAPADVTVLVTGESGTGKELVARSLHENSPRSSKPFVAINCGALAETLLESELFGHEKGAFTGAESRRRGLFEEANGGTLFLDEVGELTPTTQVKLLRVLQERHVRPVGANRAHPVDVRVVAATNRDLEEEVRERRFRDDLYYRLNVVSIELPALRARGDDLFLLAQHLLDKHASRLKKPVTGFAPEALEKLRRFDWPGNVRELENAVERAVIMTRGEIIGVEALPPSVLAATTRSIAPVASDVPLALARTRFERQYLEQLMEETGGNSSLAARRAGMDRSNFRRLLQRHGVKGG